MNFHNYILLCMCNQINQTTTSDFFMVILGL